MQGFEVQKIRAEMPSLHIKHPVTKAMFAYRDALGCDDTYYKSYGKVREIKGLHELEKRRSDLIRYMDSLGLSEDTSNEEVTILRQRILDYWATRTDADSFEDLVVMRNHMETAKRLADHADWYFMNMKVADELGLGNVPSSSLSRVEFSQMSNLIFEKRDVYHLPNGLNKESAKLRLRHHIHEKPVVEEETETKWGKLSKDYARDKETAALSKLFDSLVEETIDRFGVDILTAEPTVLTPQVKTLVDAQRYSRQLPPELTRLFPEDVIERGNIAAMPDHSTYAFYKYPNLLKSKARLILGEQDIRLPADPKAEDLVALQKKLYPILVHALSKGIETYHPEVERYLMIIAATALTEGDTYAPQQVGFNEFNRHTDQQPLAEYIPALRRLAFHRGIDVFPLTNAIEDWLIEQPMDRDILAMAIARASLKVTPVIRELISITPSEGENDRYQQRTELNRCFERIGLNAYWTQKLAQIVLATGDIDDQGRYVEGEYKIQVRPNYVIKDIATKIK